MPSPRIVSIAFIRLSKSVDGFRRLKLTGSDISNFSTYSSTPASASASYLLFSYSPQARLMNIPRSFSAWTMESRLSNPYSGSSPAIRKARPYPRSAAFRKLAVTCSGGTR